MHILRNPTCLVSLVAAFVLFPATGRCDPVPGLGAAGSYTVFSLNNTDAAISGGSIVTGDVAVGPSGSLDFGSATLVGSVYRDPTASVSGISSTVQSLSTAVSDANTASAQYDAMTDTQTFGNITSSTTITRTTQVNVITINSIVINSGTFTLSGLATDIFIINIPADGSGSTGRFSLGSANMVLSGGLTANRVLFNLMGPDTGDSEIEIKSSVFGTFLAPGRDFVMNSNATLTGAIIAGGSEIDIQGNSIITSGLFNPSVVPAPNSLVLFSLGVGGFLGLVASKRHLAKAKAH